MCQLLHSLEWQICKMDLLAVDFVLFSVGATLLGEYRNGALERTAFISIKQICTKGNICLFLVKPLKCAASVS